MKITKLLFVILTCGLLLIGYGCGDDKTINPEPGEPGEGPPPGGEVD